MPKNEQNLEIANLTCRFGDKFVLVDLLEEVVLPAFLDRSQIRRHGDSSYLFIETTLVALGEGRGTYGIAGRFVKNTVLRSEQVLTDDGLIPQIAEIPSAPSALFLLILDNHRLLYVKETSDAPDLDSFRSTLYLFVNRKRVEFVDKLYKAEKELFLQTGAPGKKTKGELLAQYPAANITLVPLATGDSLETFVKKYRTLKKIKIQFLKTNDDIDNDGFFKVVRQKKEEVGSTATTLIHANKDGLNKQSAVEQLTSVASQGNHDITLDGVDDKGDRLRGNNDEFKLKTPINELGKKVEDASKRMYSSFVSLVSSGLIKFSVTEEKVRLKITSIVEKIMASPPISGSSALGGSTPPEQEKQ